MNRHILTLLAIVLWSSFSSGKKEEHFACDARTFGLDSFESQPSVVSPDGKKHVQLVRDYTFTVFVGKDRLTTIDIGDLSCCIEVGWSPDSDQFFIMYSDSGGYALYKTRVYAISGGSISERAISKQAFEDFSSRHSCPARGPNNLFFLGWTKGSRNAFLVTEVIPTGDCGKDWGHYEGYLVDGATGSIVRHYGEKQTTRIEKTCRSVGFLRANTLK
ncbi:MAG TPA: hypothetical protein VF311_10945 [Terriglobales bacterium]|jgi:hypothetical protein